MKHAIITCICAVLICFTGTSHAREVKGVEFPDTITIGNKECQLSGVGIRKKLIISVYLGGLYLEKPTDNSAEVIASIQCKRVLIHFIYKEVGVDSIVEAWIEGFKKNNPEISPDLQMKIDRFNAMFTEPMLKDDTMEITYIPGTGTEVRIKNNVAGVIEGDDFMQALFSIWFGPSPPDKGLKKGMLGD